MELDCYVCGKPASHECGRCKDVGYCSSSCAQNHWKQHANICIGTVFVEQSDHQRHAQQLWDEGYVVIPLFTDQIVERHHSFEQALKGMPEYNRTATGDLPRYPYGPRRTPTDSFYVKGGFGALGNPSSFHNNFVREIRREANTAVKPMFKILRTLEDNKRNNRKLEQIMDRMRVFRPGASISAESWHRDTTPKQLTNEDDSIFGGWINFDSVGNQKFSAFRGSHRRAPGDIAGARPGFSKISGEDAEQLNLLKEQYTKKKWGELEVSERQAYTRRRLREDLYERLKTRQPQLTYAERHARIDQILERAQETDLVESLKEYRQELNERGRQWEIDIPPGHILIFYQEMIHEVVKTTLSKRSGQPSYRLFTGWRLTSSSRPLFPIESLLNGMEVPLLKSKQKIRMWSTASWRNATGMKNLENWSLATFKSAALYPKTVQSGNNVGKTYTVVREYMPGLVALTIRQLILDSDWVQTRKGVKDEWKELLEQDDINQWEVNPFSKEEFFQHYELPFNDWNLAYPSYLRGDRTLLKPQEL